jgi:5'-AMP-activated protein kinase regulatory gamma subunit
VSTEESADSQCRDITQYFTASVQELGIGTYVSSESDPARNPFYPLATATLQTTVFDVVHMFSEQGISAVPIVDESGRVLNLYETVDVIVSPRTTAVADVRPSCETAHINHST